jgi:hypothetical protein
VDLPEVQCSLRQCPETCGAGKEEPVCQGNLEVEAGARDGPARGSAIFNWLRLSINEDILKCNMLAAWAGFNWKDASEIADHVATVIAIGAAGIWAYFNFVKSRTYHPRMEMAVSGEIRLSGATGYVVPRVTLKNIGQSKIALIQRGSGYRVWFAADSGNSLPEVAWSGGRPVYPMFQEHQHIEPGESIFDEVRLIRLPEASIAVKIEARLVAPVSRFPRKNNEWNCAAIAGPIAVPQGVHMQADRQREEQTEKSDTWEKDKVKKFQEEEKPDRTKEWEKEKELKKV